MTGTRTWTDKELREAVASSVSIAEVLRALGLNDRAPGNYKTFYKYVKILGLDTSHFTGGRTYGIRMTKPLSEVMVKNSTYAASHLKARLLKAEILKNECAICGQKGEWQGNPLVMVLDHINGVSNDHRLENLRMLCPNCNSQQSTFSRKKHRGGSIIG